MEIKCLRQSDWDVKENYGWESNWGQLGIQYIKGEIGGICRAWGALQWLHAIFYAFCGFISDLLLTDAQDETRIILLGEFSFFELFLYSWCDYQMKWLFRKYFKNLYQYRKAWVSDNYGNAWSEGRSGFKLLHFW